MRSWASLGCLGLVFLLFLAACGPTPEPGGRTATETPNPILVMESPPAAASDLPAGAAACRGRIAFVGRHDSQVDLFVIRADGSELTQLTDDDGYEDAPSWSPDGTRLLFTSSVEANADVYVISMDDGQIHRLTEDPARDYAASWSPDGERIVFLSTRIPSSQVFVLELDADVPMPLTEAYEYKVDAAWSPDGAQIAFTMLDGYNQGDVYVMDSDGSGLTNLTGHPAHDCCAAWSPAGGRLAFLSSRDERAQRNLLAGEAYGLEDHVVYVGYESEAAMPRPLTTVMPEPPRDVYLINADGSGLVNLTNGTSYERDHAWSPDGRWLAFVSDRRGSDEIHVLDVEEILGGGSGNLIRLTDNRDDEADPVWSPDGTCIAFVSSGADGSGLYVMGADGKGLRKLADGIPRGSGLSWSP